LFISLQYLLQVSGPQLLQEDFWRSFRLFFRYEVRAFGDYFANDGRRLSDCSCRIKSGRV
jgi:hypothetical protein